MSKTPPQKPAINRVLNNLMKAGRKNFPTGKAKPGGTKIGKTPYPGGRSAEWATEIPPRRKGVAFPKIAKKYRPVGKATNTGGKGKPRLKYKKGV